MNSTTTTVQSVILQFMSVIICGKSCDWKNHSLSQFRKATSFFKPSVTKSAVYW